MRVAILGAGFMGGALTVPAADNGHRVALWGTHLDGHLIEAVRRREPHPKLGVRLPAAVTAYGPPALAEALAGAELVISAVTSGAAVPVLRRAAPLVPPGAPVLSVSKGLVGRGGRVVTLSTAIAEATGLRVVTVGGPSKAMELARRVPTAVLYGAEDARARRACRAALETAYYLVDETTDQRGLELCSALKNAYAIGIGLCDGLIRAGRAEAMHNTKSLLFTRALDEMARLARRAGARPATVHGLAGAGDLHVTGAAGRNRIFGELRGAGRRTAEVVAELRARDELTEGYAAIRWCWRFARAHPGVEAPLLRALHRIVYQDRDAETELRAACWPRPARRAGGRGGPRGRRVP